MVKETYWRDPGFDHCSDILNKNKHKFGRNGSKIANQLVTVSDTDFPIFPKKSRGWNLCEMHNWITGNDKDEGEPTLAGPVDITREQLLIALNLCSKYSVKTTIDYKVRRKPKKAHSESFLRWRRTKRRKNKKRNITKKLLKFLNVKKR